MINKNEAPEGCEAHPALMLCGGCIFWKHHCRNDEAKCCPSQREDKSLVIFKKKKTDD